jgi:hypothetical protein
MRPCRPDAGTTMEEEAMTYFADDSYLCTTCTWCGKPAADLVYEHPLRKSQEDHETKGNIRPAPRVSSIPSVSELRGG